MAELKPCPFCGEIPTLTENFPHEELFTLSCENKECKIHPYRVGKTKQECIIDWNTRLAEPDPRALTHANIQARGGLPIFIKPIGISGYSWTDGWWVFLKTHKQTVSGDTIGYVFADAHGEFDYSAADYGKTWLAYDRRPKGE